MICALAALSCQRKSGLDTDKDKDIIWQQTALDSVTVTAIVATPGEVVFAGTCGTGIFRSTDRGATWARVSRYCCTNLATSAQGYVFAAIGTFILRSADNGESWVTLRVSSGLLLGSFAFGELGQLFVGSAASDESKGGVYRSVDNGDTWLQTGFADSMTAIDLVVDKDGDLFAGTGLGVMRSSDNGQTWVQTNAGFRVLGLIPFVSDLAIDPVLGDIYAAIQFDGVYRSTDNGNTWSLTDLDNPTVGTLLFNFSGQLFAATGGHSGIEPQGVFYSANQGRSWSKINNGLKTKDVWNLTADPSGYVYAGTDHHGVFRTANSTIGGMK